MVWRKTGNKNKIHFLELQFLNVCHSLEAIRTREEIHLVNDVVDGEE